MTKIAIYLFTAMLFSACSLDVKPDLWKYKSASYFNSYTKNFLSSSDTLAKNDLEAAIRYAKTGADLTALSRIYLGVCALEISVGGEKNCPRYKEISDVVKDDELDAYYSFITSTLKKEQISLLPNKYQNFASHVISKKYQNANSDISTMQIATSQLLAAALIKEETTAELRDEIIKTASFNGYKKAVIFWLNEAKEATDDKHEKEILSKKISILKSDD